MTGRVNTYGWRKKVATEMTQKPGSDREGKEDDRPRQHVWVEEEGRYCDEQRHRECLDDSDRALNAAGGNLERIAVCYQQGGEPDGAVEEGIVRLQRVHVASVHERVCENCREPADDEVGAGQQKPALAQTQREASAVPFDRSCYRFRRDFSRLADFQGTHRWFLRARARMPCRLGRRAHIDAPSSSCA